MATQDLRPASERAVPVGQGSFFNDVYWGSIIVGALAAAAIGFVLHGFSLGIGLAASSTAPTWRDASLALVALSGLYLILVALISYGIGGYVAGRMRPRRSGGTADEIDFRDGVHGA